MWDQFDLALLICDAISSIFNFWVSLPTSLNSNNSPSVFFPIINWYGIPIRLNFFIFADIFSSVSSIIVSMFFYFKYSKILFDFSKLDESFLLIIGIIAQS